MREYQREEKAPQGHRRAISRTTRRAASFVAIGLAAACSDFQGPAPGSLTTDELLPLGIQASAPAVSGVTFYVANGRASVRRLVHADAFTTVYVEIDFPVAALAQLDGTPVSATDSVLVTITPASGTYGVTISPAGLEFATGARPYATFSFARYGDLSVADGSSRYATRAAYTDAIGLWHETSPDLWRVMAGSGTTAGDAAAGMLEGGGRYVVAAPR